MEKTMTLSPSLETKYVNPKLWEKIKQLDLTLITERMIFKHRWSKKRVQKAVKDYQQFLYLTQVFEMPLSPTKDVDIIWHDHILHTKKYAVDCEKLFGVFLHHFPIPIKVLRGQICGVDGDGGDGGNDDYGEPSKRIKIKNFCGVEGDGPRKKPLKEKKPVSKPVAKPKPKKPKAVFVNFAEIQPRFFLLN